MATFSNTTEKNWSQWHFSLLIVNRISSISNGVKCLEYGTNVQPVAKTKWSILINILSTIHARFSNYLVHSILSVPAFILAMWWLVALCVNYICFVYVCMRVTCATVKKNVTVHQMRQTNSIPNIFRTRMIMHRSKECNWIVVLGRLNARVDLKYSLN